GFVVINYEMVHDTRIIPIGDRPHVGSGVRQYMGDSRGHWEGDTLVVDVTNFTDKTDLRGSRDTLRLIERYRRVAGDVVNYEVTINDPNTFAKPWTAAVPLRSDPTQAEVF